MTATGQEQTRLMVVDDNEDTAATLGLIFSWLGYDVVMCNDGKSALKKFAEFLPSICIIDIDMPQMNGYELARRLRSTPHGNELVLATVTALEDQGHLREAEKAGFDLHFTKPADPGEIAEQISNLFQNGEGSIGA